MGITKLRRFMFQYLTVYTKYQNWQSSSAECKSQHNSYLLEDIDLTEPKKACALIKEKPVGPSWIGIAKEVYMSKAEGNLFLEMRCLSIFTLLLFTNELVYNSIKMVQFFSTSCIKSY